jgi:hypothetical protein
MTIIVKKTKIYRFLAIFFFFGSGAASVYFFYQVPGFSFLQGVDEESIRTAVSLSWVLIFPVWFVLYFAAMALLETFLRILDS